MAAMGPEVFELGFFRPDSAGVTGPAMIPRTWDAESILRSIPWMRFQNLSGRNVYIRPFGEHNLTMLDDLNADAVKRMKAGGYAPAIVVETSPGNYQVWLKHKERLPRELSTAVARHLAVDFSADQGSADWRHFGRLCGFTNRKLRHQTANGQFPFVRLIEATGKTYSKADQLIEGVRSRMEEEAARLSKRPPAKTFPGERLKSIEAFRVNPNYGGDNTRVDLAFAVYSLSRGASAESVAMAIRSRDLSHKGNERRQQDYVARTIDKALSTIEKSRGICR